MITPNALSAEDIKEISHEALRQYAFASGWCEVASPSLHFALMHPHPEKRDAYAHSSAPRLCGL